ncbi:MAG: hypothetical protein HYU65_07680 [Armatimonadetes bacterium]|nr:hypothetical protein [Armatimonadota bacterium]
MRSIRAVSIVLVMVLLLAAAAAAAPGQKGPKPLKVKVHAAGELFCPASVLVAGNIVIATGRCYLVFVLRDSRGTFLAFAAPNAKIPPGQIVRMSTPAGAKVKGRIFYLVPIQTTAVVVPMNSVMIVAVRAEDFGPRFSLTIVGTPTPNLTVVFNVRL